MLNYQRVTGRVCFPGIIIENVVLSNIYEYMVGEIAENTAYTQSFLV
jgi:hypothetical protein